jgi:hypothetical protein
MPASRQTKPDMSEINQQLYAAVAEVVTVSDHLDASVRRNLSIHHLQAAVTFALKTREIEERNNGTPFGSFFEKIMWYVSSSISMSVAALEANANEILKDIIDDVTNPKRMRLQCQDLWDTATLEKYRKVGLILDHKFDKGASVWQNARLLTQFRNALVHFKPSWSHEVGNHKLSKALTIKVHQNAWFTKDNDFPLNCFSYDAAKWAIESVRTFSRDVSSKIGVKDRFTEHLSSLVLP